MFLTVENVRRFLHYCKTHRDLSTHSLRAYEQDLNALIAYITNRNHEAQDPLFPEKYIQHLRNELRLSPSTIRRRFGTFKAFVKWLEKNNPQELCKYQISEIHTAIPKRLPKPVDRLTLAKVLSSRGVRYFDDTSLLLIKFLLVTGLRIGEATNIRARNFSLDCSRISIVGKGNRERMVYITNLGLLMEIQKLVSQRYKMAGLEGYVFVNRNGERLTEASFRKRLRSISKEIGLQKHITPHQLRHSAATLLIEEGVDIRLVQKLLGHASIATTEQYTKVSDFTLISAIAKADTIEKIPIK